MIDFEKLTSKFAEAVAAVAEKADNSKPLDRPADDLANEAFRDLLGALQGLPAPLRVQGEEYRKLVDQQQRFWGERFANKAPKATLEDAKPLKEGLRLLSEFIRAVIETWPGYDLGGIEESLDRIADGIPVKPTKTAGLTQAELDALTDAAKKEAEALKGAQNTPTPITVDVPPGLEHGSQNPADAWHEPMRAEYQSFRTKVEMEVLGKTIDDVIDPSAAGQWWAWVAKQHGGKMVRELWARELIWCYWHEEGGLVQAIEAVLLRFQNRAVGRYSPLARLDITPLRPIADLLWGFIDDQHRRLSLRRRAYEYLHEYGLQIVGKAVGRLRPADSRSGFLSAYHNLLYNCVRFYREFDNTMVNEDARPVLNALRGLHLTLSYGAHNQFGTVPVQARIEMRIIQELFNHPEFQQFLGQPQLVSYPGNCEWMGRVDTLRRALGWGDASITEYWHLAQCGERLVLSARYGPFAADQTNSDVARAWAIAHRDNVMQYIHSYRAVTGVDLSADPAKGQVVDSTQPSVYLSAREQQHRAQLAM